MDKMKTDARSQRSSPLSFDSGGRGGLYLPLSSRTARLTKATKPAHWQAAVKAVAVTLPRGARGKLPGGPARLRPDSDGSESRLKVAALHRPISES